MLTCISIEQELVVDQALGEPIFPGKPVSKEVEWEQDAVQERQTSRKMKGPELTERCS